MRAQNEPPPTVVRHVRGPVPDGKPTDIPGAYEVARVDEKALQRGEIWPQSRGSQLAGLVVGSQDGERVLDLCAAPGGKATMLAGEVTAVEANEARARELQENVDRLGAANVRVVHADGRSLPPELTGFDRALVDAPCSGLGVLAARPDLRWRSQPLPELQLELLQAAAERVRPGGTIVYSVCTINADEAEAGRRRVGPRGRADRGLGAVPASEPAGVPADAAARPRHERLLHRPPPHRAVGSRRVAGATGCGRSRSSRRSTRRTSGDSASRSSISRHAGARVFHFDVGDGHFVPPVTIGPVVLRSIAPHIHELGGRIDCHLMVDDPAHHFQEIAESGARQRHLPRRGRGRRRRRDRPGARARARGRDRLQSRDAGRGGCRGRQRGRRSLPLHVDQARLLGARSSWRTPTSGSHARASSSTASSRSTEASRRRTSAPRTRPGRTCSSSAPASSASRTCTRTYRRLVQALA